ncbi:hypothetical protein EMIT0P253_40110 [Pseudomonas sp. IT-P253]
MCHSTPSLVGPDLEGLNDQIPHGWNHGRRSGPKLPYQTDRSVHDEPYRNRQPWPGGSPG